MAIYGNQKAFTEEREFTASTDISRVAQTLDKQDASLLLN